MADNVSKSPKAAAIAYVLRNDESENWYVLPAHRAAAFAAWLTSEDWANGGCPAYARRINSPDCITFWGWAQP